MGQTIIEKIIASHTNERVEAGKIVWMDLDIRTARDFGGANVVKNFRKHFGSAEKVADPAKTFFTFDCNVPANTIGYANNQHICRKFGEEQGIKVFDVDQGIGSHLDIDEGLAFPGGTLVGTDSHLNILGAVGCFGQGMGDIDIAFAFKTGKTWFEVPPTIKINLEGKYRYPTTAKDLTLFLVGKLGASGALGCSVELYGEMIDAMSLDERITLASMATEMGAIINLLPPNNDIINFCQDVAVSEFEVFTADKDASYTKELTFNIDNLPPQAALPPKPDNVKPVSEIVGRKIDSAFIGSCTNGRYSDIKVAVEILKGQKVAPGVMLKIAPSTRKVLGKMLEEGMIETIYQCGAILINPGCAGCAAGQVGMTGEGEVQLSTSNRNFAGKQGAGDTYLVSPVTAAISSLKGEIALL